MSETHQIYLELKVPPNNSSLSNALQDHFNKSSTIVKNCEACGKKSVEAEIKSQLTMASSTDFLLVILSRAIQTIEGFEINLNNVIATDDVYIR